MAYISKCNDIQMQELFYYIVVGKAMIDVSIGPRASVNTILQYVFTAGYATMLHLIKYFPSVPHTGNDILMLS